MIRYFLYILLLVLNISCAFLPKESLKIPKKHIQDSLEIVNGVYKIDFKNSNNGELNRSIEIVNRTSEKWPAIDTNNTYTFGIELVDNKQIIFCLFENEELIIDRTVKIKKLKNKCIIKVE